MDINETVTKASQGMWFVVSDLETAVTKLAGQPLPPQGRSMEYRAALAYLNACLEQSRRLLSDLSKISE